MSGNARWFRIMAMACTIGLSACGSVQGTGDAAVDAAPAFSMLWVPQFNLSQVNGYAATRTTVNGADPADIVVTLDSGCHPNAVAFDGDGDLWVTCTNQLMEVAQADLGTSGTPTPKTVITSDGQSVLDTIGLMFDKTGSLWVACKGRLEMYTPESQAAGGPRAPDRTLTAGFDTPSGLVFDGAGNLWVNNASPSGTANNSVLTFTAAQVAAGGAQTPILTLTSATFGVIEGIAFDGAGNLWIASNEASNNAPGIGRFEASTVMVPTAATTRDSLPSGRLESGTGIRTVRKPGSIAFDHSGNLFVTSELSDTAGNDARVLRYTAAQLTSLSGDTALDANVVVANAASSPGFGGLVLR